MLKPEQHTIYVEDIISLPGKMIEKSGGQIEFLIHKGMQPKSMDPQVKITLKGDPKLSPFWKARLGESVGHSVPLELYTVELESRGNSFRLRYGGKIHHPLEQAGQGVERGSRQTLGLISEEGVYLAGSSFWYPQFPEEYISFSLSVGTPDGWDFVSQGQRNTSSFQDGKESIEWDSPEPQEEIYLIGGRSTYYERALDGVNAMVFLRQPDKTLADKYLTTTGQYIKMYNKLIGAYPYKKFALVENFWETGYGMPSFTLLGPRVIRFPFILHSSYPHEILHNWWGNSVYVNFEKGNWSEGLTTYLADHLIQEQKGRGVGYRRSILQKYSDYVHEAKDFPLTEFRARHGSVTEAVGYGKTLMFFHMLRKRLGDAAFVQGLQIFYKENKFKRAAFSELKAAFKKGSGKDMEREFHQWVIRSGAPMLRLSAVKTEAKTDGFLLTALLEQIQAGPSYFLSVPVAVYLEGKESVYQTSLEMDQKRMEINLKFSKKPLRIDIDPEFDLFRRLDRREIPPSLTLAFGAEKSLIVLPSLANKDILNEYRQLAIAWQNSRPGSFEIKKDNEIEDLPSNRSVWILGWQNRFLEKIQKGASSLEVNFTNTGVRIENSKFMKKNHSVVMVLPHLHNPELAMTWVATANVDAIPGLSRKLIHYGKYSYLGFEGDEPSNIAKGEWPVLSSPLSVKLVSPEGLHQLSLPPLRLRQALIGFPPDK